MVCIVSFSKWYNAHTMNTMYLGSVWVWSQAMRDDVTMWRHLLLADPISRMTPVYLYWYVHLIVEFEYIIYQNTIPSSHVYTKQFEC